MRKIQFCIIFQNIPVYFFSPFRHLFADLLRVFFAIGCFLIFLLSYSTPFKISRTFTPGRKVHMTSITFTTKIKYFTTTFTFQHIYQVQLFSKDHRITFFYDRFLLSVPEIFVLDNGLKTCYFIN